jgi:hypothetical protein
MNWVVFAMALALACAAALFVAARRSNGTWTGYLLAVPLVIVISLNGAAPVRALADPQYVGYSFGLLSAQGGLPVTLMAGSTILAAFAAAYVAVTRREGPVFWLLAVVCGSLALSLGAPLIETAVLDIRAFKIQLGEYLTIPGVMAVGMMFLLLIAPFLAGAIWAARRAVKGSDRQGSAAPAID